MEQTVKMKTALTIAGSDSSGGAGIQADIKTMCCLGVYAMSAVTALTAQNTQAVDDILETPPEFLEKQLDCIFTDIFPDAVKTGMLPNKMLVESTAIKLREYNAKNIVVDPVMISSTGKSLTDNDAVNYYKKFLFPIADIITPNISEAEILSDLKILTISDMERAAATIGKKYGCAVLCKGGHYDGDAIDVLFYNRNITKFGEKKINNPNNHGTGCTLSSAIASYLALGEDVESAVKHAKDYITQTLKAGLNLGKGKGPLAHNFKFY